MRVKLIYEKCARRFIAEAIFDCIQIFIDSPNVGSLGAI